MDRMIYTAMSGAKQSLDKQAVVANNMANVSTPGFRAQLSATRAVPVEGEGAGVRVSAVQTTPGMDVKAGTIDTTGRSLDVAIDGDGWLAVGRASGGEAYTRNGGMQLDQNGMLSIGGRPVLDNGGQPLVIPGDGEISIAGDGTVSVRSQTGKMNPAGQIKLVKADPASLERGDDGLFSPRANENGEVPGAIAADPTIKVISGALESSNVSSIEAMVSMIDIARRFEMNMKTLSTADENAQKANQLLAPS